MYSNPRKGRRENSFLSQFLTLKLHLFGAGGMGARKHKHAQKTPAGSAKCFLTLRGNTDLS